MLTRAEIDYKAPLKSGDCFTVKLRLEKESRLRFLFIQDIYKEPDDQHILHGCPGFPPELEALLATP